MAESLSGLVRSLKGAKARCSGNRPRYGVGLRRRCLACLRAADGGGRSVREVAQDLGLPEGTLYRWREEERAVAPVRAGRPAPLQAAKGLAMRWRCYSARWRSGRTRTVLMGSIRHGGRLW
jgi:hypothetical protein